MHPDPWSQYKIKHRRHSLEADRLVAKLRGWDTDGDGKFTVEEVLHAAVDLEDEKRKSKRLWVTVVMLIVLYIVTLCLFLGASYAAVEISKDFRPQGTETALKTKEDLVVATREYLDEVDIFELPDTHTKDLYKMESLYLTWTSTVPNRAPAKKESMFRIAQVEKSMHGESSMVTLHFTTGSRLEVTRVCAQLWDVDGTPVGAVAVSESFDAANLIEIEMDGHTHKMCPGVSDPEYESTPPFTPTSGVADTTTDTTQTQVGITDTTANVNAQNPVGDVNTQGDGNVNGANPEAPTSGGIESIKEGGNQNAINPAVGGGANRRRVQTRSSFGTGCSSGNVYFNTGKIYDGGIVDFDRQRFQALGVTGRCRGTRFACTY
eukprot:GDKI01021371.1.p1 GENE.GDKI01021371.1~~GDKI01021371.1.p1  ORF type:complete len:377 (-),score=117.11 GDKI01021371.1:373-1503(-)